MALFGTKSGQVREIRIWPTVFLSYVYIFVLQLVAGVGSCGASFVMGPHFCEEHRAAHITPNSQKKLEEMRVIFEKGDKPEVKELVRQLQKLVPGIVIIEDETQQEH